MTLDAKLIKVNHLVQINSKIHILLMNNIKLKCFK